MERPDSGDLLVVASGIVELLVLFSFQAYSSGTESIIVAAVLLIVPSFLVGYFNRKHGFGYGLILGVMPAIFALALLPADSQRFYRFGAASILFVAYVLLSGLSGAGGQFFAQWRMSIWEDE
jgi:hypothetical protein